MKICAIKNAWLPDATKTVKLDKKGTFHASTPFDIKYLSDTGSSYFYPSESVQMGKNRSTTLCIPEMSQDVNPVCYLTLPTKYIFCMLHKNVASYGSKYQSSKIL